MMLRTAILALLLLQSTAALAQQAPPASEQKAPPQVQQIMDLLRDPAVQAWLEQQKAAPAKPAPVEPGSTLGGYTSGRLGQIHDHIGALFEAVPDLPAEFDRAGALLSTEFEQRGPLQVLLLLVGFVAVGFAAERLYRMATRPLLRRMTDEPHQTILRRLLGIAIRLLLGCGLIAAFAVGSVGTFLLFNWPPLLRELVFSYLAAFLAFRIALILAEFLLKPRDERLRLVPMSNPSARFWYYRLGLFVGWFGFGKATIDVLAALEISLAGRQLLAYAYGLGLVAIAIEMVWRRPSADVVEGGRRGLALLFSAYACLLWVLWVASAMPLFWFLVYAAALPGGLRLIRVMFEHVSRAAGETAPGAGGSNIAVVSIERGMRAILIVGATLLLAHLWDVDLIALTSSDTLATRLLRGVLNAVVILLIADLAWRLIRTVIDRKIAEAPITANAHTPEARRLARIRTLLPILRNVLFILLIVMSLLMVLAAMGVEIGPLIAGAGVVGVAVGFGAQTLVKDIISGVFYMLDDAFRVGEYIQSGSYKGTVESFSLRSVKLRHHRGPLYTVPFGVLGAVENLSRDWVIDKLTIGVTFDTDLAKVKSIIKQVGKDLAKDPDLAPHILEPLKMQGVDEIGDFAMKIRMKFMAKPGEQFTVRRRAYAMIKKAFAENNIKFAFPTVQVAGEEEVSPAVAQQALQLVQPPVPGT